MTHNKCIVPLTISNSKLLLRNVNRIVLRHCITLLNNQYNNNNNNNNHNNSVI